MCLAQGPQRSDAGEARTRCLSVSSSNCLDPEQDQHSVCPDLGKTDCKCYQQMTKVVASKERVLKAVRYGRHM